MNGVLCLGFLKFLKRDKSKELDLESMEDLDMPPLPPESGETDFGSVEKELPELPELPEMPEAEEPFPKIEEKPVPELKVPSKTPIPELKVRPLPEFPKPAGKQSFPRYLEPTVPKLRESIEPKFPQPVKPLFGAQKSRPIFGLPPLEKQNPKVEMPEAGVQRIEPYERMERAAVREERAVLRHKKAKEPVFIRADRFRDILTGTDTIRNNLKTAGQSIVKLDEIGANRAKVLDKWSNVMIDLQKKLIFIDKTLFKR